MDKCANIQDNPEVIKNTTFDSDKLDVAVLDSDEFVAWLKTVIKISPNECEALKGLCM